MDKKTLYEKMNTLDMLIWELEIKGIIEKKKYIQFKEIWDSIYNDENF